MMKGDSYCNGKRNNLNEKKKKKKSIYVLWYQITIDTPMTDFGHKIDTVRPVQQIIKRHSHEGAEYYEMDYTDLPSKSVENYKHIIRK